MPCTEHQKKCVGTQKGFLQTIFSLVWMGFDNEAHYFFSTDLQRLEKKQSPKRESEKPLRGKSRVFSKKKVFFMNQS